MFLQKIYRNKIAILIILVTTALAVFSFWNDSLIVDEIPHIGAGYSYITKRDMRSNPEHPPLAKIIGAVPLLFYDVNENVFDEYGPWQTNDHFTQWNLGRQLIYNGDANPQSITRAVKVPMLIFFVLGAFILYKWTKERYNANTALLALFLFTLSPTILAHSRYVATDIPATVGILATIYFFVRYLKNSNWKNLWITGFILGLALLTKFSVAILVLYIPLLALICGSMQKSDAKGWTLKCSIISFLRGVLVIIIAYTFVVWPVYLIFTSRYPVERQVEDTERLLKPYKNDNKTDIVKWLSNKPILRSIGHYGLGLYLVQHRATDSGLTYFRGKLDYNGSASYFPLVYLAKEPLPILALGVIALIGTFVCSSSKKILHTPHSTHNSIDIFAILLFLIFYWALSIRSTLNIGVRHLLPIYPFMIMLISIGAMKIFKSLRENKKALKAYSLLFVALLMWYGIENIKTFPNYLGYFNQTISDPKEFVVDSNLDWGQDAKRLGDWVKENEISKIETDYFGWADVGDYVNSPYIWINSNKYSSAQDFITSNTSDGWLAISAQNLMTSISKHDNRRRAYAWLDDYEPIEIIGSSIYVYKIK